MNNNGFVGYVRKILALAVVVCALPQVAVAVSFTPDSVYAFNGSLGIFGDSDGDPQHEISVQLNLEGTVTTSGLNDQGAIQFTTFGFAVLNGSIFNVTYDAAGAINPIDDLIGTVDGGQGLLNYTNTALVDNQHGGQVGAVFKDDMNPATPQDTTLPQGDGSGTLGAFGILLETTVAEQSFSDGINLEAKSIFLDDALHGDSYHPVSPLGAIAASFGQLDPEQGLTLHAWIMSSLGGTFGNPADGAFFLTIGAVDYRIAGGDFHGALELIQGPPAEVPEPATMALLSLGLLGMGTRRRRKREYSFRVGI